MEATEAGWTVVRIWECEIRRDTAVAAQRVATAAREQGGSIRSRSAVNQSTRARARNSVLGDERESRRLSPNDTLSVIIGT